MRAPFGLFSQQGKTRTGRVGLVISANVAILFTAFVYINAPSLHQGIFFLISHRLHQTSLKRVLAFVQKHLLLVKLPLLLSMLYCLILSSMSY